MKDRQREPKGQQARLYIISDVLHCVAMTVTVYLRSSFGFVYLGPKSVFIAFGWAMILFSAYSWIEPGKWQVFGPVCIFGLGATLLYIVHLIMALSREIYRKGEHDQYSGTSHLVRFLVKKKKFQESVLEMNIHLWMEPALVLLAAFLLRLVNQQHLSTWLSVAALCLWLKELQNYWSDLRRDKRQKDVLVDVAAPPSSSIKAEPPKPTRTAKVKRARVQVEEDPQERQFAEILRLLPPYTLKQAESNYHTLIKEAHPDKTTEESELAIALNGAIEYFRQRN